VLKEKVFGEGSSYEMPSFAVVEVPAEHVVADAAGVSCTADDVAISVPLPIPSASFDGLAHAVGCRP
jgi:hypothetical protein